MPLSLLDLINHVGQEHIRVQPLNSCITNATRIAKTGDSKITFVTNEISPGDLLFGGRNRIGLILWIEKERLPK